MRLHDIWYVFALLTYWALLAHPSFSHGFTGLHDSVFVDFDDVVLEKHYDALGYDLSFRGWA